LCIRCRGRRSAACLPNGHTARALGGTLTEALSWRWILLINVPIGIVAAVAALRVVRATQSVVFSALATAAPLLSAGQAMTQDHVLDQGSVHPGPLDEAVVCHLPHREIAGHAEAATARQRPRVRPRTV
jgi:hypothetical protein